MVWYIGASTHGLLDVLNYLNFIIQHGRQMFIHNMDGLLQKEAGNVHDVQWPNIMMRFSAETIINFNFIS